MATKPVDRLLVLFGDQLDRRSAGLAKLDRKRDVVLMIEAAGEASHVPSHKQRTVLFLSAMRHFAEDLRGRGYRVRYVELDEPGNTQTLDGELERAVAQLRPKVVTIVRPGDWRVLRAVETRMARLEPPLEVLEDGHFYLTPDEFAGWAADRKALVQEHFYRMSDYCASCRYDPMRRDGEHACPFSTFYWDFLIRHARRWKGNRRMATALRNLDRLDTAERRRITALAGRLRARLGIRREGRVAT